MDVILGLAFTMHFGFGNSYNQIHPHIRLESENNIVAGAYYNSIEKVSAYTGYKYMYDEDIGLEFGIVSGYFTDVPFVPYVRGTYKDFFMAPILIGNDTGLVTGYELNF